MKNHFVPRKMAVIKNRENNHVIENLEPLYTTGGNVKWFSCCKNQFANSSKT